MEGDRLFCIILLIVTILTSCQPSDDLQDSNTLSRRRRYIVFPDGSSFSIAFCVTWFLVYDNSQIFTTAVNWAVSYSLPNETIRDPDTNRIVPPPLLRRHRREFYNTLEVAMDKAGLDGRSCIKRALCEAPQQLKPKSTVWKEILRVLFMFPLDSVDVDEPLEHHTYDAAFRRGLSNKSCPKKYKKCPFSLIHMFLTAPR